MVPAAAGASLAARSQERSDCGVARPSKPASAHPVRTPVEQPRLPSALDERRDVVLAPGTNVEAALLLGGAVQDDEATDVDIVGCKLVGLGLTAARLERLRLMDVVLDGCELSAAAIEDANLVRVRFERCRMTAVSLAALRGRDVTFVDCKLVDANLGMADLAHCDLLGCDLTGADLSAAQVIGCRLLGCTLDRCQLSRATFTATALHGSTFEGTLAADSLRGASIGHEQLVGLARPVLAALGFTVEDEPPD